MKPITQQEITNYVAANIQVFHQKRLDSLQKLKLMNVVRQKNPYLFKAKNINTAQDFVKGILDARLSSQEETIFGGFLEEFAIFICTQVYGGRKSSLGNFVIPKVTCFGRKSSNLIQQRSRPENQSQS